VLLRRRIGGIYGLNFGLEEVREAYAELEKRHTRGKIVLVP
jgi:D-arabinose 1-dehydrogenase-like Zn-dependent alcohol dehydrogenase